MPHSSVLPPIAGCEILFQQRLSMARTSADILIVEREPQNVMLAARIAPSI